MIVIVFAVIGGLLVLAFVANRLFWITRVPDVVVLMLLGAVLGCTSSTIVLPVLQQVKAREPVRITLSLESALGDVFAVLAVGILLDLRPNAGPVWHDVFRALLSQIMVAALLGLLDGLLW